MDFFYYCNRLIAHLGHRDRVGLNSEMERKGVKRAQRGEKRRKGAKRSQNRAKRRVR